MGTVMFPVAEGEYAALAAVGKTVEYAETRDAQTMPEGDDWVYWSERVTPEEAMAVWRRIVFIQQMEQ